MLRIKVGGDIIRTARGKILNFAQGEITYSSEKEVIETAPEITYGKAQPHPEREERMALAVVEFLPGIGPDPEQTPSAPPEYTRQRYTGQFGFDYFRKKNSFTKGELPYFDSLTNDKKETGYYGVKTRRIQDDDGNQIIQNLERQTYANKKEQYDALKKEYACSPIHAKIKKEGPQGWEEEEALYYTPYLTLYSKEYVTSLPDSKPKPEYTACLAMGVEIIEDLDSWEFEYDTRLFSHSLEIALDLNKTSPITHYCNLELTCLRDFDREQEIKLYAYPKASRGKSKSERESLRSLAGKIKVLPNAASHRKKLKVFAVQIYTDVTNSNIEDRYEKGKFKDNQVARFYQFFHQAYIEPEIEYFTNTNGKPYLDMTQNPMFKKGKGYVNNEGKMIPLGANRQLLEFQKIMQTYIPEDKKDSLVIYFFGIQSSKRGHGGVSGLNSRTSFVYEEGRDEEKAMNPQPRRPYDDTPAHEAGHALGLWHSFSEDLGSAYENGRYFFKPGTTLNLMDYSTVRKFLYKWQWEILRSRL